MEMVPVSSSNIKSIGHDGKDTMRIEFSTGKVYEYYNVSPEAHKHLMAAPSVGKHFGANVKGNYRYAAL